MNIKSENDEELIDNLIASYTLIHVEVVECPSSYIIYAHTLAS